MINEIDGVEEVLIVDDEHLDIQEVTENEDYLIVEDPTSKKADDWCVLFVKGDYKDMVVKFEDVGLNTETGELGFAYTVLSEDREVNTLNFTNYLTSTLNSIILDMHEKGAQRYIDLETKEELDY
jgi:hypothetical protein